MKEPLDEKPKMELIEDALLKHVSGGIYPVDTCGGNVDMCWTDAGTNCAHDWCYQWQDMCYT